jgi:hypothetical protein
VDQCKTDGDCRKFGDYSCSSENVCVANMTNTSGSGSGGTESEGGTKPEGGTAGAPVVAECTKNKECIDDHDGEPYICQEEKCVPLTIPEHCPYVVAGTEENPTEYLTKPGKPIIFGAYVPIDASNPEGHPYTLIYKFALEEFMQATLGGVDGHPFVMVLCQSTKPDLAASVAHLVDTVQVPAILATLPSADLSTVYNEVKARPRPVFLLGPFEADSSLISQDESGLLWHMLGPVTDLLPTYVPLFELAESYVRNRIRKPVDRDKPVKVAIVNTDLTYSLDLANSLPSKVKVNGAFLNASTNRNNYQRIQVQVAGKDSGSINTSGVITALKDPGSADIVVSLGGAEFIDPTLTAIQGPKALDQSPFYILSPRNAFDPSLSMPSFYFGMEVDGMQQTGMTDVDKIMAGVNYASVEDSALYDKYLADIQARYPEQKGLESRENMYDAAYFMLYSLTAALLSPAGEEFDGEDVVNGMSSLIGGPGSVEVTVGLGENAGMVNTVLGNLRNRAQVKLVGTLGPPDFKPDTGARNSPGSVWCVSRPQSGSPSVSFDMLRMDPKSPEQLKLSGSSFCYPNFFPLP